MLSLFPGFFTYAIIAPFILRVALGTYFIWQGIKRRKDEMASWDALWAGQKIGSLPLSPILAKIQIVIGIFLFVGLYTQFATILAGIFIWLEFRKKAKTTRPTFSEIWMAVFMTVIAISLLFLGAGIIAFDLPL
jgi:uncharacterized membrane protein YphA (DoxX/SURF4 family)